MKRAGYYIFFVFNYIITLLPLRVLYLLSDFFYIVIYYIAGYRRRVVEQNLRNAFPEKSPEERKEDRKRILQASLRPRR